MKLEKFAYLVLLCSCASGINSKIKPSSPNQAMTVYVYPSNHFSAAKESPQALEENFRDILHHVGNKSRWGRVGVGLVFMYLRWTEGADAGPYKIPQDIKIAHEKFLKAAQKLGIPVMVQFNGAVWHDPGRESAFLRYWKTREGGRYLSRYADGRVNASITHQTQIPILEINKYLDLSPYDREGENSLFFTLSHHAKPFHRARLSALSEAVHFWQQMDEKYPGVITAFSTDSEVSNFSFRIDNQDREISIGYEEFVTGPYCSKYGIKNCQEYFSGKVFGYSNLGDRRWFDFRAHLQKKFVEASVVEIRKGFSKRPVYTHQIPTLDGEYVQPYRRRDFASPQSTAFVDGAYAGFTVYIYERRDKKLREIIKQVSSKTKGHPWGFMEFNPGKKWRGSREELARYTYKILSLAHQHGVNAIAPLAWISNSLDTGIRGSGVDAGIKRYLEDGPSTKLLSRDKNTDQPLNQHQ